MHCLLETLFTKICHEPNIIKDENKELDHLQQLTDARIRLFAPLPIKQLEAVRDDLKRRGMWEGD